MIEAALCALGKALEGVALIGHAKPVTVLIQLDCSLFVRAYVRGVVFILGKVLCVLPSESVLLLSVVRIHLLQSLINRIFRGNFRSGIRSWDAWRCPSRTTKRSWGTG